MKVSLMLGTRPEISNLSPIIRQCRHLGLHCSILYSGQHYSYNMDRVFFQQLQLPEAKYNLDVGSGSYAEQTGKRLMGMEKILSREKPDRSIVPERCLRT